jgi:hypothetical protein
MTLLILEKINKDQKKSDDFKIIAFFISYKFILYSSFEVSSFIKSSMIAVLTPILENPPS